MYKITIVAVGKLKEKFLLDAMAEYAKRLSRFCQFSVQEIAEKKTLQEEGEFILRHCTGKMIALAIEGMALSSHAFAQTMQKYENLGQNITFVIGSSNGLAQAVKDRADCMLSFSKMTFPHQLMRVILTEQIYRAFTINHNILYHK